MSFAGVKVMSMAKQSLQIKGYSSDQIRALLRDDPCYLIGMRLYAVYQVSLGQSSRKLEKLYGVSFKQITNWVHRFEEEGLNGLKDRPGRGRKSKLTKEHHERLVQLIMNELPQDYGYQKTMWTGPLLMDWIEKNFQIRFQKAQVYNILADLRSGYQQKKIVQEENTQYNETSFANSFSPVCENY